MERMVVPLAQEDPGELKAWLAAEARDLGFARVGFAHCGPFEAERARVEAWLEVGGRELEISVVSMGNPHAVQVVADAEAAPVAELGPLIEHHPRFPQRVNAGFMQVVSRNAIRLRVFERGAGETLACGTGACAAVVAGIRRGLLDESVRVSTHGGELTIRWAGGSEPVWMTGPAETVYEGSVNL